VKPILVDVAERVRVRRLSDEEGQRLLRLVRRGEPKTTKSMIRYRRAMVVLASAGGNSVPVIARLVAADEDTVREVIHRFNELGMGALDPHWAGGRPRRIQAEEEQFLIETASTRPEKLGQPFTHWSVRKLVGYLAENAVRIVRIGRERARQLLAKHKITFQRTKTWKESPDPDRDAKLARIEQVLTERPDRTFAFDEFGPLACVPTPGACWAPTGKPARLRANYHKTAGVRQFHGCYCVSEDRLWGVVRHRKSRGEHPGRAALDPRRPSRPGTGPRDLGQPVCAQGRPDPPLGGAAQRRVVFHPDLCLLGQPDRGALRTAAVVCPRRVRPPQPRGAHPGAARPPALAQHPRPPSRPAGRPTTRTSPGAQRTPPPVGPAQAPDRGMNQTAVTRQPGERSWSRH
jgi:transposase